MRKELEYAKKIALVRKLFRAGGLSEAEYNRVRAKLMDMYHVIENDLECFTPKITLKRHCTGFSVVFMFTNVDESESLGYHDYSVTPVTWRNYLPGTTPDDFYIKLYRK